MGPSNKKPAFRVFPQILPHINTFHTTCGTHPGGTFPQLSRPAKGPKEKRGKAVVDHAPPPPHSNIPRAFLFSGRVPSIPAATRNDLRARFRVGDK